jgi:hypothetical protein
MQGLPWQTFGSIDIRSRQSFMFCVPLLDDTIVNVACFSFYPVVERVG